MLKAKEILCRNGMPVCVDLTEVARNTRYPATMFGFTVELPDKLKERMREQIVAEVREAGKRYGLDDDEIEEHIEEHIDDTPIECLAAEPFEQCWN